jgi:hypothetical protein
VDDVEDDEGEADQAAVERRHQMELARGEAIKQYLLQHKVHGTTFSEALGMLTERFPQEMKLCQWHRLLPLDQDGGGIRLQPLSALPQVHEARLENALDIDTVEVITDRLDVLGAVTFAMRGRGG